MTPAPAPAPRDDGLPASWTASARDTFDAVTEERPDLTAAEAASLFHACALESSAERLDAVALAAGYVATGSTGQVVAHPAAVEARLARTAAAAILARLASASSPRSRAASNAARARWSGAGRR